MYYVFFPRTLKAVITLCPNIFFYYSLMKSCGKADENNVSEYDLGDLLPNLYLQCSNYPLLCLSWLKFWYKRENLCFLELLLHHQKIFLYLPLLFSEHTFTSLP